MTPQTMAEHRETHRIQARFIPMISAHASSPSALLPPANLAAVRKPKLLDQVRDAIRTRHYSLRTEDTYLHWMKRFIFFHNKRHPREMGEEEIGQFLAHLATDKHVSASTQNQALNALLCVMNTPSSTLPKGVEPCTARVFV